MPSVCLPPPDPFGYVVVAAGACPPSACPPLILRARFGRFAFCAPRTARLIDAWRDWRGACTDWLFCPIYQGVAVNRSLSATTVRRVVQAAAARCCDDPTVARAFSGHSMRVGAAQDLLKRGLDTVGIMRAGGWKSVNVLARYLEQADHNPWL